MFKLDSPEEPPRGLRLDRLAAFSDAVIAIAITILVLGIEVPSVHEVPTSELVNYLRDSLHPILGFMISFVLIGTYWLEYYCIFHFFTHATRTFVAINFLFLLCITFLPFPTGLQAVYRDDVFAMVLYGGAQLLCSLSLLALWIYSASNYRLVKSDTSPLVVNRITRHLLIAPTLSCVAIGLAFLNIWASRILLALIPLIYLSQRDPGIGNVERTPPR